VSLGWHIAIPSYKRPKTIRRRTLALLERSSIPPERVTIFVASHEEADCYRESLAARWAGRVVVGLPTLCGARRFIREWYPEKALVFSMDDDVRDVLYRLDNKRVVSAGACLRHVIEEGFALTEAAGLKLWGIYPTVNPYFMKPTVTHELRYIVGALWGIVNTHDPRTYVSRDEKEDYERSLRHYLRDGGVVRLNYLAVKTAYYTEPGGMQEDRTQERIETAVRELLREFPMLCVRNRARKKRAEILLKDKRTGPVIRRTWADQPEPPGWPARVGAADV